MPAHAEASPNLLILAFEHVDRQSVAMSKMQRLCQRFRCYVTQSMMRTKKPAQQLHKTLGATTVSRQTVSSRVCASSQGL